MPKGINNITMGQQHNSFKKDIDMLSEAYGHMYGKKVVEENAMLGGAMITQGMGEEAAEDKTGHLSDKDLLSKVEGMGTAGKCLIDAAKKRLDDGESLTAHERDALARDAYGDAEKKIAKDRHEDESYEQKMDQMGAAHGFSGAGKGHATD